MGLCAIEPNIAATYATMATLFMSPSASYRVGSDEVCLMLTGQVIFPAWFLRASSRVDAFLVVMSLC